MSETAALRHRDRRHDGRAAPAARRGRRRRSRRAAARLGQRSGRRRRARRAARGRSSSRAGRRGKAASFGGSEEERQRILAEALALGAEYVDVEWRARFDDLIAQTGGRRVVLSAHDFTACRPTSTRACARHARDRRRGRQDRRDADQPQRLRAAARRSARRRGRQGGLVLIGMGAYGLATRVLAGALRIGLDLCGRAGGHRPGERAVAASTTTTSARSPTPPRSTASSAARSRTRSRRRCTTRRFAPRASTRSTCRCRRPAPTTSRRSAARFGISGASVTIPLKVVAVRARRRGRRGGAAHRRDQHDSRRGRPLDRRQHRCERLPGAAAGAGRRSDGLRAAVLGAGGAARAVAVALASSGCAVTAARAQPAAGRREPRC